jgi:hypothetical protein
MAICPKCRGTLDLTSTVCPHCGYDFPPPDSRRGIVYSPLADLALVIGTVVAGLGCVAAVLVSAAALLRGEWIGLFWCPLVFFLLLAMLVVFVRVQQNRT